MNKLRPLFYLLLLLLGVFPNTGICAGRYKAFCIEDARAINETLFLLLSVENKIDKTGIAHTSHVTTESKNVWIAAVNIGSDTNFILLPRKDTFVYTFKKGTITAEHFFLLSGPAFLFCSDQGILSKVDLSQTAPVGDRRQEFPEYQFPRYRAIFLPPNREIVAGCAGQPFTLPSTNLHNLNNFMQKEILNEICELKIKSPADEVQISSDLSWLAIHQAAEDKPGFIVRKLDQPNRTKLICSDQSPFPLVHLDGIETISGKVYILYSIFGRDKNFHEVLVDEDGRELGRIAHQALDHAVWSAQRHLVIFLRTGIQDFENPKRTICLWDTQSFSHRFIEIDFSKQLKN